MHSKEYFRTSKIPFPESHRRALGVLPDCGGTMAPYLPVKNFCKETAKIVFAVIRNT